MEYSIGTPVDEFQVSVEYPRIRKWLPDSPKVRSEFRVVRVLASCSGLPRFRDGGRSTDGRGSESRRKVAQLWHTAGERTHGHITPRGWTTAIDSAWPPFRLGCPRNVHGGYRLTEQMDGCNRARDYWRDKRRT